MILVTSCLRQRAWSAMPEPEQIQRSNKKWSTSNLPLSWPSFQLFEYSSWPRLALATRCPTVTFLSHSYQNASTRDRRRQLDHDFSLDATSLDNSGCAYATSLDNPGCAYATTLEDPGWRPHFHRRIRPFGFRQDWYLGHTTIDTQVGQDWHWWLSKFKCGYTWKSPSTFASNLRFTLAKGIDRSTVVNECCIPLLTPSFLVVQNQWSTSSRSSLNITILQIVDLMFG